MPYCKLFCCLRYRIYCTKLCTSETGILTLELKTSIVQYGHPIMITFHCDYLEGSPNAGWFWDRKKNWHGLRGFSFFVLCLFSRTSYWSFVICQWATPHMVQIFHMSVACSFMTFLCAMSETWDFIGCFVTNRLALLFKVGWLTLHPWMCIYAVLCRAVFHFWKAGKNFLCCPNSRHPAEVWMPEKPSSPIALVTKICNCECEDRRYNNGPLKAAVAKYLDTISGLCRHLPLM